jgi:site-specific DNA-methyltransferase (adenine-specific)
MKSNTFSDCELAWCRNRKNAARLFRYLWNGICQAGEKHEKRYQPMQKPIRLMEWCIGMTNAPIIIDPYMGSGSTGLAALRQGRSFIGIEIKPQYFHNAVRRVEKGQEDRVGSG